MLDRLYASLASGPSINCRPHNSRQRVDLTVLSRLDGTSPQAVLAGLLGEKGAVKISVRTSGAAKEADAPGKREEDERQALLRKLGTIAEDARTFEQDTGAQVLHVGFPLLNLPPDSKDKRGFAGTRRILAPIAFIPVRLTLKKGRTPGVELEAATDGVDRVMPNTALLAWVERQTGKRFGELFADEQGQDPWREVNELAAAVAKAMEMPALAPFTPETPLSPPLAPRTRPRPVPPSSRAPCSASTRCPTRASWTTCGRSWTASPSRAPSRASCAWASLSGTGARPRRKR